MLIGIVLAGLWLLLAHALPLLGIQFANQSLLLTVLQLVAGILMLVAGRTPRLRSAGYVLFGVWLALAAVIALAKLNVPFQGLVMAILALVAGILMLVSGPAWVRKQAGTVLTAVWLLLVGLVGLLALEFAYREVVLAVVAIGAGLLLLIRK